MPGQRGLGWAALERAAWEEARHAFEAELLGGETPALLEGYSWALWWLNLGDAALAARERAYNAYRQRGDHRGAARVATWLASDVIDFRCDTAVSSGWLRRAHRLLDRTELSGEHGWLALHEGTLALDLSGDTATAARLGTRCAEIGAALEDVDLEMLGTALCGLAAVHDGAVSEGLGRLDEAATAAIAGELAEYVSVGWSCCSLIKACEEVRDYDRAAQWSQQMIGFAHRLGFEPWVRICRSFHAWVLVCRGEWEEADRQLVLARDRRPPPGLPGRSKRLCDLASSGDARAGSKRPPSCSKARNRIHVPWSAWATSLSIRAPRPRLLLPPAGQSAASPAQWSTPAAIGSRPWSCSCTRSPPPARRRRRPMHSDSSRQWRRSSAPHRSLRPSPSTPASWLLQPEILDSHEPASRMRETYSYAVRRPMTSPWPRSS